MNSTNRILNRIFVFLVGLLVLTGGVTLALVALIPLVRDSWTNATRVGIDRATRLLQATPLPESLGPVNGSWLWLIALAAGAVLSAALVTFSLRQGHGQTGRLVTLNEQTSSGAVDIEAKVAEHAIQEALTIRPELVAFHVSTYRVKNQSALKVAITCRRGISPREASQIVNEVLFSFDNLLGLQLPALVQIGGGFRARTTKATRIR
ncbi:MULTISPECIES: hypothetical protein [Cryobacterium]|uniref:Alkaline shock response membrane anchor protein AmaP n=1 Tax=Cryobacterium breve TaxID=1259258 RepID=A0ABY2IU96_9MICO|nr:MULTISPECIES: hypothetical protein [Cryobacterium]TFC94416.1 hypothetical protein E3T20_07905 [Cryobacterium sp. TmT3-12]TFC95021.1 hypothetical protein E3O65_15795 [Cryobacterium breve]